MIYYAKCELLGSSASKKWALGFCECISMHSQLPLALPITLKVIEVFPDDFCIELSGHSYLHMRLWFPTIT